VPVTGTRSGWDAWSAEQADKAQKQFLERRQRLARAEAENDERLARKALEKLADLSAASQHTDPAVLSRKRAVVEAALARAKLQKLDPTLGDPAPEDSGKAPG
jgi:electron transport complex protein RnfB